MKKNKQVIPGESVLHSLTARSSNIHAEGATAKRILTGFENRSGGFDIGSGGVELACEPGIAAARRPNPIRDAGETEWNTDVLPDGAVGISSIDALLLKGLQGSTPQMRAYVKNHDEAVKAVLGRESSVRAIGEVETYDPQGRFPVYGTSTARYELMKQLLSPGACVVLASKPTGNANQVVEYLRHQRQFGHLEVYVAHTICAYRDASAALGKEMRKASKRAIKKVAKHK